METSFILFEPEYPNWYKKTVKAERVIHKNEKRIKLLFDFDKELINLVHKIEGARWSATLYAWHVPDNAGAVEKIYELFRSVATIYFINPECDSKPEIRIIFHTKILASDLQKEKIDQLNKYKYWLRDRRYSESTIESYLDAIKKVFIYYKDKSVHEITNEDIIKFNNDFIIKNNYSLSLQNQIISSIKLFFNRIGNRKIEIDEIQRPKRWRRLPVVMSKEEVEKLLKSPVNLKHRMMLSLIYACGLRRSELMNLTPVSIDFDRKLLIIRHAKGNKDRVAPLPLKIIERIKEYISLYKPEKWLFEGYVKGEKYSEGSLQEVFRKHIELVGIKKKVTLHSLRHSYATHLLENGTDLRYIQEILGHKSSKTTEIYTHVTTKNIERIKSPFDDLNI